MAPLFETAWSCLAGQRRHPLGSVRPGPLACEAGRFRRSGCRLEDGSLWDDTLGRKPPQWDQELPRKGDDHDLAHATCATTKVVVEPTNHRAVWLVALPDPGKLHQNGSQPGVAGSADPPLALRAAAAVIPMRAASD
jgi:hypothetical protein